MRTRVATVFALILACACMPLASFADALDGVLEVRSAYINVDNGVFKLNARIAYPRSDAIRLALRDGVTLEFEVDAVVSRERRLWFDADVVNVQLRRELSFHTVSDRYIVRDVRHAVQESYTGLEEALEALGTVTDWPILVAPQLSDESRYRVAVRAGVRRGRLADALRAIMFWSADWHRTSEWYSWTLPS